MNLKNDLLSAALAYAARGWRVFPTNGKRPRIREWQKRATTDAAQIREWWQGWPVADIGIATGELSGLVVLDVDTKEDRRGDASLLNLIDRIGPLRFVAHAITGSGGDHFYLGWAPGIKNGSDVLGLGLDIRSDGGFVVAPPSAHASGARYHWAEVEATGDPIGSRKLREVNA